MTEQEEAENIVGVCKDCIDDQIKQFNDNLPDVNPGDFVKAMFSTGLSSFDGPASESMWIEIEQEKPTSYIGTLNNTPHFIDKHVLRLGDHVEVQKSQCWSYLPKKDV